MACSECQKVAKWKQKGAPLRSLPVIDTSYNRIGMDMVGPLPRTKAGNKHILVIVDHATRWPEAFTLRNTGSRRVADVLLPLFCHMGVPREVLTDCGAILLKY